MLVHPVRLAGNVLLVVAYKENYDDSTVIEWGYILQNLGYTFFLSATLSFYQRAKDPTPIGSPSAPTKKLRSPAGALGLLSTVGLVLLIIGYTDSTGLFPSSSGPADPNATLDVKARIGDIIFCVVTLAIALLTVTSIGNSQTMESKRIFQFIILALPFMAIRVGYVTYESFTKHPLQRTLWAKIVFEYVMEIIVVIIYFVLGFATKKVAAGDMEMKQGYQGYQEYMPYDYRRP